jgi:hypothetical protein
MANQSLGTIREFNTARFRVVADAIEDYGIDLSYDEDGSIRRKLERGDLISFTARVRVFFEDAEIGSNYLGGCVYESLKAFEDHRECGAQNRKLIKQEGRFQIYRKARPYEHCLSASDKLKKRGLATREKAEVWATANAKEPWQVFETALYGSCFADMISQAIAEARKFLLKMQTVKVRRKDDVQEKD